MPDKDTVYAPAWSIPVNKVPLHCEGYKNVHDKAARKPPTHKD